jgi:toprim domain protein
MDEHIFIIVEGKNDRSRLRRLLPESVPIALTYGIPNESRLQALRRLAGDRQVIIFTDADATGRRIRKILRDAFPDAQHLYTKTSFQGVEATPLEYLANRLRAVGLEPYDADDELSLAAMRTRSGRKTKSANAMRPAPR